MPKPRTASVLAWVARTNIDSIRKLIFSLLLRIHPTKKSMGYQQKLGRVEHREKPPNSHNLTCLLTIRVRVMCCSGALGIMMTPSTPTRQQTRANIPKECRRAKGKESRISSIVAPDRSGPGCPGVSRPAKKSAKKPGKQEMLTVRTEMRGEKHRMNQRNQTLMSHAPSR